MCLKCKSKSKKVFKLILLVNTKKIKVKKYTNDVENELLVVLVLTRGMPHMTELTAKTPPLFSLTYKLHHSTLGAWGDPHVGRECKREGGTG